jgi:Domain of unknown function (DUF4956)/MgtC family
MIADGTTNNAMIAQTVLDTLKIGAPSDLTVIGLCLNLAVGALLSYVLAWHYRKFGRTMTNRAMLARTFPLICLTTVLIISVVKSSLALSLGLVGALSIIRFRTPIKEPEELAYLFLTIAIGLGLGADQLWPTVVASVGIMLILALRETFHRESKGHNLYLNIEIPNTGDNADVFTKMTDALTQHVRVADVRRLDHRNGVLAATFYIDCDNQQDLIGIMDRMRREFGDASISFVEQGNILGG